MLLFSKTNRVATKKRYYWTGMVEHHKLFIGRIVSMNLVCYFDIAFVF